MINKKQLCSLLALLGMLAVIFGAFGAHYLEKHLDQAALEVWNTAVFYHFIHVLAGFIPFTLLNKDSRWAKLSALLFILGIFFFSGSLYLLSTDILPSIRFILGPITPLGGLLFIAGWGVLVRLFYKSQS